MLQSTLRNNPPWKIYEAILVFVLVIISGFLLKNFGQGMIISLLDFLPGGASSINQLLLSSLLQTVLFLVFIYYFVFIKYKEGLVSLGFSNNNLGYWVRKGILHGISLFFLISLISLLINLVLNIKVNPQDVAQIIMSATTKWEMFIPFIVTGVFAPISEEIYFRGFLYQAFRKRVGVKWAIAITSIIFGSVHFDLIRFIPITIGGVWLNLLYERSGSIYPSMIAHGVWNSIMTFLIFGLG
ncbi:hypothetical protein SAMN00017405_0838 [Desulfonispora thiosulfatigenes DSM 11270]|uniref:CAAX prenyl protease 2/Lysostaphin resistance protein A-like domain-containing protein n=1 Tax=Desulfonispora thiosulfatigenes DSM 11270 TaxID=656914 RepID=A0A1W1UGG0_DESTI|nr:CPBP family intramembrane glutamic endopeptidase [Desulfonispora thiosulfatigenes]SMB80112.1 hypothetical protein SAMN00017405_0838 [Desulfonispora thiosulfatigenes DSM 11270]